MSTNENSHQIKLKAALTKVWVAIEAIREIHPPEIAVLLLMEVVVRIGDEPGLELPERMTYAVECCNYALLESASLALDRAGVYDGHDHEH